MNTARETRTESLRKRALRSSGSLLLGFGSSNLLRLASNLILTRLLFPEAFGLMALVQVFIVGLSAFSDIGVTTSVITSPRGDERNFLNTAWTLQILRGVFLWLIAVAISNPIAEFYGQPEFAPLFQVASLSMVIMGFFSTKAMTAGRHIAYGRLAILEITSQATGIIVMIVIAYEYRTLWALPVGGLVGAFTHVTLSHLVLPGMRNNLCLERQSFWEIFHFGKFLFVNTMATFVIKQGDRAILGAMVTLGSLGIYNIGMFLGSAPLLLGQRVFSSLLVPLYRMRPPAESAANRKNMRRARRMLIAGLFVGVVPLMFGGIWIVDALYDPRYTQASAIVVLFAMSAGPMLISEDYGNVLLANQDSKTLLILTLISAVFQLTILLVSIHFLGVVGAAISPGLTALVTYPIRARFAARYGAWDPIADFMFFIGFGGISISAVFMHQELLIEAMTL